MQNLRVAMLIDVSRCIGCRACQVACKQWNQLPTESAENTKFKGTYQNLTNLSANTWTMVKFIEPDDFDKNPRWLFRKHQCMHCNEAVCIEVCPTKAIKRHNNGIITIDQKICKGLGNCVENCPFSAPKYDDASGKCKNCRMCLERVANNLKPACATSCATGAIAFGTREEMLKAGKEKLQLLRRTNPQSCLYGATELGGLGVMYLLPDRASVYGLPENSKAPNTLISNRWLKRLIPGWAILAGVLYYINENVPGVERKKHEP